MIMKKIKLIIASSLVLTSSFVFANQTHITDQFLGEANAGLDQNQDVFGGNAYEIDSFDVNIDFDKHAPRKYESKYSIKRNKNNDICKCF